MKGTLAESQLSSVGPGGISGGTPLLTSCPGTNSPFLPSRHCDVDGGGGVSLVWPSHLLQSTVGGQAGPVSLDAPLARCRLLQNARLKTSGPMWAWRPVLIRLTAQVGGWGPR